MKCPRCLGAGWNLEGGSSAYADMRDAQQVRCYECGGTGIVPVTPAPSQPALGRMDLRKWPCGCRETAVNVCMTICGKSAKECSRNVSQPDLSEGGKERG